MNQVNISRYGREEGVLKTHIIVESILVGMLGIHAATLVQRFPPTAADRKQAAIAANQRLRFTAGRGLNSRGGRLDREGRPTAKRVVGFLLRDETLGEDIAYWQEIARQLPPDSSVELIGYCERSNCEGRVQPSALTAAAFRIMAYGEVVDSQAVLNADGDGKFVVAGQAGSVWRQLDTTPAAVAKELRR